MTNILTDKLPESVIIDGLKYPVNWDFKTMLRINIILNSESDDIAEQCLGLFYGTIPVNIEEAADKLIWFYHCGEIAEDKTKEREEKKEDEKTHEVYKPPVYSFEHDSSLIYAAFYEQYGIDLSETNMHWWKFKSLFDALGGNTLFAEVRKIRAIEIDANMSKAQQKYYREMKKIYALPLPESEQRMIDEITDALQNGGNVAEVMSRYEKG